MEDEDRPILIVEDTDADYDALARAFRLADPSQRLLRETTSENALKRLDTLCQTREVMPLVTLVDLNLPGRNGLTFVKQMKTDPRLCVLPVIVLTSSTNPNDAIASYQAGASSYIAKPFELKEFVKMIAVLHQYWTALAVVPPSDAYFEPPSGRNDLI
jgi:two-component system, response regulator